MIDKCSVFCPLYVSSLREDSGEVLNESKIPGCPRKQSWEGLSTCHPFAPAELGGLLRAMLFDALRISYLERLKRSNFIPFVIDCRSLLSLSYHRDVIAPNILVSHIRYHCSESDCGSALLSLCISNSRVDIRIFIREIVATFADTDFMTLSVESNRIEPANLM